MSNLSELLPAGSSVKSADFVAQGTLASGVTVGLRSDGKVEAISGVTGSNGTAVQFSANNYAQLILSFPVPSTSQIVVAWQSGSDGNKMKAKVGTVTGNVIVFSSSVIEVSSGSNATWIAGCFETGLSKVVLAYTNSNNLFQACCGSISGTGASATINLGTRVTLSTAEINNNVFLINNPSATGKAQLVYRNSAAGTGGYVVSLTVTAGNGVTVGTATQITSTSYPRGVGPTASNDKTILVDSPNGGNLVLYVASYNSGNDTWSLNSSIALGGSDTDQFNDPVISANGFIAVTYRATYPTVKSFTLSGTTLTQTGTALVLSSDSSAGRCGFAYDATAGRYVFAYRSGGDGGKGKYSTINFSGTAFTTVSTAIQFTSNTIDVSLAYNASQGKTIFSFSDGSSAEKGMGQVYTIGATNVSSYVGITDQAISSAATGKVVCKGGAITNTGLLSTSSATFNTAVEVAGDGTAGSILYDPTNNKVIALYADGDNSNYGTAKVGTVSGTSTSWGSATVFESATATQIHSVYDVNAQRVVVVYQDGGNSSYPTVVIGTVAGTGISFGTPVVAFSGAANIEVTYDAGQQKCLVTYRPSPSNSIFLMVGTVSGTSISFGSPLTVSSTAGGGINGIVYDANAAKSVLFWGTGLNAEAAVATISGTSVSVGSTVQYSSGTNLQRGSAVYDSVAQKVVTVAKNSNNDDSTANVGTVSGTSISFGTEVIADSTINNHGEIAIVYDVAQNKILHVFSGNPGSGSRMYSQVGAVSGTTTTWSTPVELATNYHYVWGLAYNSSTTSNVLLYSDYGSADILEAQVATIAQDTLVIGSNYFVQDDGTISTTSSTTKAGTALSTTSLLLTG